MKFGVLVYVHLLYQNRWYDLLCYSIFLIHGSEEKNSKDHDAASDKTSMMHHSRAEEQVEKYKTKGGIRLD